MRTLPLLLLVLALVGCGGNDEVGTDKIVRFTFDSGGAHHIQGLGAWRVEAVRGGAFSVTHQVRDVTKGYGRIPLPVAEGEALWKTIDGANLESLKTEERAGVPDEVKYTFGITPGAGGKRLEVSIWQNDLAAHASLAPLLDALRTLIQKHHGVKPAF